MSPRPLQPLPSEADRITKIVVGRVTTIALCAVMIYFYARTMLDMLRDGDAGTQ